MKSSNDLDAGGQRWGVVIILLVLMSCSCRASYENQRCEKCVAPSYADRICDRSGPRGQWLSNATHINIGVLRVFNSWSNQNLDIQVLCALEHINSNEQILPNQTVDIVYLDGAGKIEEAHGIENGLCMEHTGIPFGVGPQVSGEAVGSSIVGKIFKQNIIGATSSAPLLSNKDRYPYFSRVFPSDAYQGKILARIAHSLGIRKMFTIAISPNTYLDGIIMEFTSECIRLGIHVLTITVPPSFTSTEAHHAYTSIINSNIRAGFIADNSGLPDLLITGKELGVFGANWTWFGSESLFNVAATASFIEGFIGVLPGRDVPSDARKELFHCVDSHMNDETGVFANLSITDPRDFWNTFYYDGLQIMARALHSIGGEWDKPDKLVESIRHTRYNGVTGPIEFDHETGDRLGVQYQIVNSVGGSMRTVGSVDSTTMRISFHGEPIMFPGGSSTMALDFIMKCTLEEHYQLEIESCEPLRTVIFKPIDGDPKKYCPPIAELSVPCDHALVWGPTTYISCAGQGYFLFLLGAIFKYRTNSVMRRSQPHWIALMVLGCMFLLIIPQLMTGELENKKCAYMPTFLSFGYLLVFCPLFLKSAFIHNIYAQKTMVHKRRWSQKMFIQFICIVVVNSLINTLLIVYQPVKVEYTSRHYLNHYDIPWSRCAIQGGRPYMLILVFFIGALTIYGCSVSYAIRNIGGQYSESRWIFLSVYNGALLGCIAVGIAVNSVLGAEEQYLIVFGTTLGISLVTSSLIILPKLQMILYPQMYASSLFNVPRMPSGSSSVSPDTVHTNVGGSTITTDDLDGLCIDCRNCECRLIQSRHLVEKKSQELENSFQREKPQC